MASLQGAPRFAPAAACGNARALRLCSPPDRCFTVVTAAVGPQGRSKTVGTPSDSRQQVGPLSQQERRHSAAEQSRQQHPRHQAAPQHQHPQAGRQPSRQPSQQQPASPPLDRQRQQPLGRQAPPQQPRIADHQQRQQSAQQGAQQRQQQHVQQRPAQASRDAPHRQQGAEQAAQQGQQRSGYPYLVVVEGVNDMRAVKRAAPGIAVYVLGTSTAAGSQPLLQDLAEAASRFRGVVVLTDPDVAGRQARRQLDDALPGCLHAFLPSPLATAGAATRHHEEGNVGVEHAAPQHIRAALSAPRRSDPGRAAFTREQLLGWGLVAGLHERGGQVTARRRLVCAHLGLGDCDGKQLMRQLNRYCFGTEEVERALQWADAQLAALDAAQ